MRHGLSLSIEKKMTDEIHLLASITFHFVEDRLKYLNSVLDELISFNTASTYIVIYTNDTDKRNIEFINDITRNAADKDNVSIKISIEDKLSHPFNLTWCHKTLVSDTFLSDDSHYTHFVYIEDDELFTFENLCYFVRAREALRPHGLIPSYVRTEWSSRLGRFVSSDNIGPMLLNGRPAVEFDGCRYVNFDSPYCGSYVLDRELAREYVNSPSFDRERSSTVNGTWGIRERAAMGLTFEAPPPPFAYRVVAPVSATTFDVPRYAWLAHLPNNYAEDAGTPFGSVPMDSLFYNKVGVRQLRAYLRNLKPRILAKVKAVKKLWPGR